MALKASNYNKNAPWWWKRFESAAIFCILTMIPLVGLSQLIPELYRSEIAMVWLPAIAGIVKGIGIMLGQPVPEKS